MKRNKCIVYLICSIKCNSNISLTLSSLHKNAINLNKKYESYSLKLTDFLCHVLCCNFFTLLLKNTEIGYNKILVEA